MRMNCSEITRCCEPHRAHSQLSLNISTLQVSWRRRKKVQVPEAAFSNNIRLRSSPQQTSVWTDFGLHHTDSVCARVVYQEINISGNIRYNQEYDIPIYVFFFGKFRIYQEISISSVYPIYQKIWGYISRYIYCSVMYTGIFLDIGHVQVYFLIHVWVHTPHNHRISS